jgi:uncharacterized protein YbgA (DUF1722 family)
MSNHRQSQKQLLVFVKVLLRYLKKAAANNNNNNNSDHISIYWTTTLYQQAKTLVATCVSRNRAGDPNFSPLQPILESLLHELVGDTHWNLAQRGCRHKNNNGNDEPTKNKLLWQRSPWPWPNNNK